MIKEDFIFDDNFRKTTIFYFITSFWNTDKKQNLHRQFPQESESQILERLTQWLKKSKSSYSSVYKIKQY